MQEEKVYDMIPVRALCPAFYAIHFDLQAAKCNHFKSSSHYTTSFMILMLCWPLPTCRNAFGPSAGTVCLSGLLILVVRVVRAMVDSARQEDTPGMFKIILRCCVNTFLAAVDYLNKFTITFAAITGEAYCSSARMTYELLKRNLLSTVFVETISTRLLLGIAFVLSAIYAIVVRRHKMGCSFVLWSTLNTFPFLFAGLCYLTSCEPSWGRYVPCGFCGMAAPDRDTRILYPRVG